MSFSQIRESDLGTEVNLNDDGSSSEVEETESSVAYEPRYIAHEDNLSCPESTFNESECGEPTRAQRFTLDFTPGQNTELDTPAVRQKVMSFFEFINSQKDLAHLCQIPLDENEKETCEKQNLDIMSHGEPDECTFAQNILDDYKDCLTQVRDKSKIVEMYPACPSDTESNVTSEIVPKRSKIQAKEKATSIQKQAQLSDMCKTFEEWDQKHPKSMDPPGPIMRHRPIMMRRQPLERDY